MIVGCLLVLFVLVASAVQRLSGMGFALVAAPVLVLVLGPADGVGLANCASGMISLAGLASEWRGVQPRRMVPLVLAAIVTVPAGAWLTRAVPEPTLLIGIGAAVTVAATLVIRGVGAAALRGVPGAVAAGATSGLLNAAAGVGGPAISLYAVNSGWSAREFRPNAQFYGVVVNAVSLTARGLPTLSGAQWSLAGAAVGVGTAAGFLLAGRVPERQARTLVLTLALAGGLVTLGKGLTAAL
ncbi:sulfite exporter TauE/SafE family protein [Kitasatospora sp. NPDC049285]|uniref:sulfite exporter TauE/SafE family protein n=1 Tax=Kitasatospora sp. NPDC049285 TaxID=3157096 RepID=UPI00341EE4FC